MVYVEFQNSEKADDAPVIIEANINDKVYDIVYNWYPHDWWFTITPPPGKELGIGDDDILGDHLHSDNTVYILLMPHWPP